LTIVLTIDNCFDKLQMTNILKELKSIWKWFEAKSYLKQKN